MKINYKNTALHLLDHIDPKAFRMYTDKDRSGQQYATQVGLSVCEQFPKVAPLFSQKKQFISTTFDEAYAKAKHKLAAVIDAEPVNMCGTFIAQASPSETNTIFYHIITEGKGSDFKIYAVIFSFRCHTKSDKPSLTMIVQRNDKGFKSWLPPEAVANGMDEMSIIADILTMLLFLKYCELQTKVIKGGKKDNHIGVKYVNDTRHDVEILDSTWFTTIVKSDGFHVRGHFRFQPCGQGMRDRKLIWIADYDKEGYTRVAKVLHTQ